MLSLRDLTASLQATWANHAPIGVPSQFPGSTIDLSETSDWYEFWVDLVDDLPQRAASPSLAVVIVTVHCFSQDPRRTLRATELADAVVQVFAGQVFPIHSPAGSAAPVGMIRFLTSARRQMSRPEQTGAHQPWRHQVVTLSAMATQTIC